MVAEKKTPAKKTESKAAAKPAAAPRAAAPAAADGPNALQKRNTVEGVVVSDKMQKTIVVRVDRRVRHTAYKKYILKSVKYKAHDEKNDAKKGDRVQLVESRPLSRDKRWALSKIVRRAAQVAEINA